MNRLQKEKNSRQKFHPKRPHEEKNRMFSSNWGTVNRGFYEREKKKKNFETAKVKLITCFENWLSGRKSRREKKINFGFDEIFQTVFLSTSTFKILIKLICTRFHPRKSRAVSLLLCEFPRNKVCRDFGFVSAGKHSVVNNFEFRWCIGAGWRVKTLLSMPENFESWLLLESKNWSLISFITKSEGPLKFL